jgi:hypothetical protein
VSAAPVFGCTCPDCKAPRDAAATSQKPEDVLFGWWVTLACEEAEKVVPKAIEYGATDLVEIGRTLGDAARLDGLTEAQQAELGVYFYLVGKMARWTDAIKTGRQVSDDTLHDIGVYVRMAQRIRAAGSWPGVDLNPTKEDSK